LDEEKALDWLNKGAQPSDTVKSFLSNLGIMKKYHESLLKQKGWYYDTWNKQESDRMGGLTDG